VSVVCCQVEVSESGRSYVQRIHTKCVSKCDHEASIIRRSWPTWDCCAMVKQNNFRWRVQITKLFTIQIFTTLMSLALNFSSPPSMYERSLLNTETYHTAIRGQNLLYPSEIWGSQGGNCEEQWHCALWLKYTKHQRSLLPTASENWELSCSRILIRRVTVQRNRRAYQLVKICRFRLW
jgi:hypothetical protein